MRPVDNLETAIDVLRELAHRPMITKLHFEVDLEVDRPVTISYTVNEFCWKGERREEC